MNKWIIKSLNENLIRRVVLSLWRSAYRPSLFDASRSCCIKRQLWASIPKPMSKVSCIARISSAIYFSNWPSFMRTRYIEFSFPVIIECPELQASAVVEPRRTKFLHVHLTGFVFWVVTKNHLAILISLHNRGCILTSQIRKPIYLIVQLAYG